MERYMSNSKEFQIRIPLFPLPKTLEQIVKDALEQTEVSKQGKYRILANNCQHFCSQICGLPKDSTGVNKAKMEIKVKGVVTFAGILLPEVGWLPYLAYYAGCFAWSYIMVGRQYTEVIPIRNIM